jgi:hypothetical protein
MDQHLDTFVAVSRLSVNRHEQRYHLLIKGRWADRLLSNFICCRRKQQATNPVAYNGNKLWICAKCSARDDDVEMRSKLGLSRRKADLLHAGGGK